MNTNGHDLGRKVVIDLEHMTNESARPRPSVDIFRLDCGFALH